MSHKTWERRRTELWGSFRLAFERAGGKHGKMGALAELWGWAEDALRPDRERVPVTEWWAVDKLIREGWKAPTIARRTRVSESQIRRRMKKLKKKSV